MIIGLCGPEGAGKSTAARILSQTYGLPIRPFAEPIKTMLVALGVPPRHIYGTPAEKLEPLDILGGKSARHALQTLGTEWGRNCIDPDLWVRAWAAGVPAGWGCIADDLRFPNEQAAIREAGGMIFCIVRSAEDFKRVPRHPSENFAALRPDRVFVNDDSFDRLAFELVTVVEFLTRKRSIPVGESATEPSRDERVLDSVDAGGSK